MYQKSLFFPPPVYYNRQASSWRYITTNPKVIIRVSRQHDWLRQGEEGVRQYRRQSITLIFHKGKAFSSSRPQVFQVQKKVS